MDFKFPKDFFFGASTSAHQVEGGNHNDWTEFEHANSVRLAAEAARRHANAHTRIPDFILKNYPNPLQEENYISGKACDHYNRFREDFDIAKQLGHNAHRFSIEWSRIEPEEGKFNEREIEHYREVIKALRERGIEPFVTLWHWTLPAWARDNGGIYSKEFPKYFSRYVEYVVKKLGQDIRFWITLNEPGVIIRYAYLWGIWPPQKRNIFLALKIFWILAEAHKLAFRIIHDINKEAQVGSANAMRYIEAYNNNPINKFAAFVANFFSREYFLRLTKNTHDFIGLNYYIHHQMKFPQREIMTSEWLNDMGWEVYPEGIYHLLRFLKKHHLPIYITENGIADARDLYRARFIKESLAWVEKAMREGVDVRGYFYWSLLDNFEWDKGFWPRFGLVEIDYKTLERKVRSSAWAFKSIIEGGGLSSEALAKED